MIDATTSIPNNRVTLGLFSGSHLGDALCSTPLPRLLRARHGWEVFVTTHRSSASVFANNPYVSGFRDGLAVDLFPRMRGHGHVIQRLQQGFRLPVEVLPRPEVYLDQYELAWAGQQRSGWPSGQPACIFSTRVLTDMVHFDYRRVDWEALAAEWSKYCTIVQPVMTRGQIYHDQVAPLPADAVQTWKSDPILPGAVVYPDLSVRQYLSLFAVADYFCGGSSGGSHAAAAFGLPSLIIVWHGLIRRMRFPCRDLHLSPATFVYPQHRFLEGERVRTGAVDRLLVEQAVRDVVAESNRRAGSSGMQAICMLARNPFESRNLILRNRRGRLRRAPRSHAWSAQSIAA